jgi:hypothetical protein
MLERDIEQQCLRYAKSIGWLMPKWVSPGNAGVHDRLLLVPARVETSIGLVARGVIIPIEFKQPNAYHTAIQRRWGRKLDGMMIEQHTIRSLEEFEKLCEGLMKREN